jgi:hypothetical protein
MGTERVPCGDDPARGAAACGGACAYTGVMATRTFPQPALSASLIRRRPLLLAPPSAYATPRAAAASPAPPAAGWSDDLRFFATCYAAGVVFFLIMLS